jgi:chromosome partitioning protein
MTRIVSFLNFKGGTGKTTTVVNLGMGLAMRGYRVLAMDLDAQGSVAGWLGARYEKTLAELLLGKAAWFDCVTRARARLDIIAADRRLTEAEQKLIMQQEQPDVLRRRLAGIEGAGYDFILLDCPPSMNLLSECALHFSQEVCIPVSMEYLAVVSARLVVLEIVRTRRLSPGHPVRLVLVIPTFYDRRYAKSREIIEMLQRHFPGIVAEPIRASARLSEAPSHHLTIFEYDPTGPGSTDYARLVERIIGHA